MGMNLNHGLVRILGEKVFQSLDFSYFDVPFPSLRKFYHKTLLVGIISNPGLEVA